MSHVVGGKIQIWDGLLPSIKEEIEIKEDEYLEEAEIKEEDEYLEAEEHGRITKTGKRSSSNTHFSEVAPKTKKLKSKSYTFFLLIFSWRM